MRGRHSNLGTLGRAAALALALVGAAHPCAAVIAPVPSVVPAVATAGERWAPPLARPIEVSGPYRAPPHRYGSGHRGIDLPAVPGEQVLAPASGTVTFAGSVVDRETVTVRIDDRTVVSMEPVIAELAVGAEVRRGARIGTVSSGGHCASECVHVGVRVEGEYVNPMRFFAGRPVLLPWNDR